MIERPHPAPAPAAMLVRAALSVLLAAGLAGCRHKAAPVTLPQVSLAPIDLEVPPQPEKPPMIEAPPETAVDLPPLPPPPPRRPAPRKPAPAKETPPPTQVASAAEPAALAIGELSSGGDSTPQSLQQTRDLIAAIKKRLAAVPSKIAGQQKDEVSQVNRFLKQAQQALDSGDAEGAKNLAIKAKLLMDDIEKK